MPRTTGAQEPEHHWNSHADVARNVMEAFNVLDSYRASFSIKVSGAGNARSMSGRVYYSKPGKLRFEFDSPARDLIVSDGKILWIYINRLHAVGKQDLALDVKNENGRSIFMKDPDSGISRLFRKYHYRFDGTEQPRKMDDGSTYFVMDLEQREKVGGYENIKLFIDPQSYLIKRAIGKESSGKSATIEFSSIEKNPPVEGKLFQFKPDDSMRVVMNPLVNE